ncbi:hypothetical protein PT286_10220, partial [Neisseriaceae bacterium ESL0693]|nr:hypothetical protein [Neisseriaceae bacterium ESL0693]
KKQAAGAGKKEEEKKPSLKETLAKADLGAAVTGAALTALQQRKKGTHGTELAKNVAKDFWTRVQKADQRVMVTQMEKIKAKQSELAKDVLLTGIYDEQIHDSRASFMHNAPMISREPFSNYFSYRLIYSGSHSNKPLSGVMLANRILGLAGLARSAYMSVKFTNPAYLLLGLHNPELFVGTEAQNALKSLGKNYDRIMVDPATGRVLPT